MVTNHLLTGMILQADIFCLKNRLVNHYTLRAHLLLTFTRWAPYTSYQYVINGLENIVYFYHNFRQLWQVLGVKLMEINSNLFSRGVKQSLKHGRK